MKKSKWYQISTISIVVFSLGYFSAMAYFYLWDKYKINNMKKWAITYFGIYLAFVIWFLWALIQNSTNSILLWILANFFMYLIAVIQIIYVLSTVKENAATSDEFDKSLLKQESDRGTLLEEKYAKLLEQNSHLENENKLLEIKNNELKDDYYMISKELLELKQNAGDTSNAPELTLDALNYRKLKTEHIKLEKDYQDLLKRFENLQDTIIEKHEIRNKTVHQQISRENEQMKEPKLNETSFLKEMGYQITGKNRESRWKVLERAVARHGLKAVVKVIDGNIALRVKQNDGRKKYAYGISEWNYDLERLKNVYYRGNFPWPPKR